MWYTFYAAFLPLKLRVYMIEQNVPIPIAKGGALRYPFKYLTVGDSVLHPCTMRADKKRALKAAFRCAEYHGWRIVSRSLPEGVRIWRTE